MISYEESAQMHLNFLSLLTEDKQLECMSQLKDTNPDLYDAIKDKEKENAEIRRSKEESQKAS